MAKATNRPKRPGRTPAQMGFAMPAEWEPHEATWMAWPHRPDDFPGKLAAVRWAFVEIIRRIVPGETVRLIVESRAHRRQAERMLARAGADPARVELIDWPTDRGWTRDFGPVFVKRTRPREALAVVDFRFNAWCKYPQWRRDDRIAARAAKRLRLRRFVPLARGRQFVLEGGAIDVNGQGTLITTEQCLLQQRRHVRNPGTNRIETENILRDYLGADNVIWLSKGIAGDDTNGHVDDFCRFVGPRTVVLCHESDPRDANHAPLADARERLQSARLPGGAKLEIVPLPMPAPLYFDGLRLPASYANFYIANAAVLVPTFNDPSDRVAMGTLAELFPGREVVGIHAVDLVLGLGAVHCLTQQRPALDTPS